MVKEQQKAALRSATGLLRKAKQRAFDELEDAEELKDLAREMKRRTIANLDSYLEQLARQAEAQGVRVFRARSAAEAVSYICELAERRGVRLAVKSKSMVTEEIGLNRALEERGIEVIETDLGERIIQLAQEKPSHIIAPAIHKDRHQVAELFSRASSRDVPPDPTAIAQEARRSLRQTILTAGMGITGVNMAIAETGTLALVTNEGNARLVTAIPPIHVAVMGEEKVVPSIEDAFLLLKLLPRSGTGQRLTSYVTFINGPNPAEAPLIEGASRRELHLVIVDNGRRGMVEDAHFRDALGCIKCGACLNVCPTYRIVGGHVFGHIYSGPIGIPWTYFIHGEERAMELSPLCVSCGLCGEACPVKIDIPEMIMRIKHKDVELNGQPLTNRFIAGLEAMSKVASSTAPLSNWLLHNGPFRLLMEKLVGIDRRRPLPKYHRGTFMKCFRGYMPKGKVKVAYFVDIFANYNDPDLGRAVVEVLERNDIGVTVPEQRHSGMPLLSYGNFKAARKFMQFNVDSLARAVREGCKVIASEPTAAYCIKRLYPYFLENSDARLVADNTHELFEYLSMLLEHGLLDLSLKPLSKGLVGYHAPCHTKSMLSSLPVVRLLKVMGLQVRVIDQGCCGIAGTYGFKKGLDGYDMSMEIGRALFEEVMKPEIEMVVTESSVCKMQMEVGTSKPVIHPIKLLREAYGLS